MKKYIYIIYTGIMLGACDSFLDEKPSKDIDTPGTLDSLQALLDNSSSMNVYPAIPLMLGDEYFSNDAGILSLPPWQQNLYLWKDKPFQIDDLIFDWRDAYNQIQTANIILEALEEINTITPQWNEIKGAALFFRAQAYFNLYNLFLDGHNLEQSGLTPQIPIRRSSKILLKAEYTGKEEIKKLIREDMEESVTLLPEVVLYPFRPSVKAAKAFKARVYLAWEEYANAQKAAGELIQSGLALMDYKKLNPKVSYPFDLFNSEVLWHSRIGGYSFMFSQSAFQVNPELLALYEEEDLRKSLLFIKRPSGYVNFRGSYDGGITLFAGLAADEVYLIYAECLIRAGDLSRAADVLNSLLVTRYAEGFEPLQFDNETAALEVVLKERRKELLFRGLRWQDLRRLNKDDRFKTTLERSYENVSFKLAPNSENYLIPVPPRELSFN
ncbi:SusD-like starch-binding protein associating with outer membrane [Algoriphagus ratkowskyi]|uniref:RagB/SusD family nutrient uptake outer membrane protein n=1 Tax=Algoriphagus ratkowskyi TaxID=57028 RepID=A0A2W7QV31_9BACT|nr:RagB/SusD family nutrient uptake outer membrane protein [Algoriphagus ratkowskyi]PZX49960.1 SusD-like starch-binding protein associating with outer membrane [Algoriphagus ratkowskyi]TXD75529.1 RagB/SusD family nutrient uptake outer membrane protein [Algoriphagus ratkowskyi]